MDYCSECDFDYEQLQSGQVPGFILQLAQEYRERLCDPGKDQQLKLCQHNSIGVWSALEYACHVRDVLVVQHDRLRQALGTTNDPEPFVPMGREELVIADRYNKQPPTQVAEDLGQAAEVLSAAFAALLPGQWEHEAIYSDGRHIDMLWLARHTSHELVHHLMDVDRQLQSGS